MKNSTTLGEHFARAHNSIHAATPTTTIHGTELIGAIFIGHYVSRALNHVDTFVDLSTLIHRTFSVQTAYDASFLHAGNLDFVFLIVDIETDLPLAVLVAKTLQAQGIFTCCIALSPTNPSGPQQLEGMCRNAEVYRKAANVTIPFQWAGDQIGIRDAIQACTCISKSVLDTDLLGIDFEDLCTHVFQQGCECAFESKTHLLMDTSPQLTGSQWLSQATAALVIVETPTMHIHGLTRIAKSARNLVRAQMQPDAYVIYAVTINNTLHSQYKVSVLATKNRDQYLTESSVTRSTSKIRSLRSSDKSPAT